MATLPDFPSVLFKARLESNSSQASTANLLGVHRNSIHNWESGKTLPTLTQFVKLSNLFPELLSTRYCITESGNAQGVVMNGGKFIGTRKLT